MAFSTSDYNERNFKKHKFMDVFKEVHRVVVCVFQGPTQIHTGVLLIGKLSHNKIEYQAMLTHLRVRNSKVEIQVHRYQASRARLLEEVGTKMVNVIGEAERVFTFSVPLKPSGKKKKIHSIIGKHCERAFALTLPCRPSQTNCVTYVAAVLEKFCQGELVASKSNGKTCLTFQNMGSVMPVDGLFSNVPELRIGNNNGQLYLSIEMDGKLSSTLDLSPQVLQLIKDFETRITMPLADQPPDQPPEPPVGVPAVGDAQLEQLEDEAQQLPEEARQLRETEPLEDRPNINV